MKRLPFLAALIFAALISVGCGGTEVEAGAEGAADFSLTDGDGKTVQLSDYKGQVVLLNFWATWCGPCKIEMPWFVEFQRKYKDQGFSVVAVSMDEEGWDIVKPYLAENPVNFPVVVGDEETAEKFGGVMALPTTLIIDKEGTIHGRHTGLVDKEVYENEIKELL